MTDSTDVSQLLPVNHSDQLEEIRIFLLTWFPDFQYSKSDDLFFAALRAEYPKLDLLRELKSFHAWCLDNQVPKTAYRLTFRKWLSRTTSYKRSRARPS
jgi:hypothetical protein